MKIYNYLIHKIISLLYPSVCLVCKTPTRLGYPLCTSCYKEYLLNDIESEIVNMGSIEFSYTHYYIKKLDNNFKKIIHYLKYKNFKIIGKLFGKILALKLKNNIENYDFIISVPLSNKKRKIRGYNQSELISYGVSKILKTPVLNNVLVKSIHNSSQTRKSKKERLKNVKGVYNIINGVVIRNKKILLIDDVYTTGATTESCIENMLKYSPKKVDVLTLAKA